ncbi:GntR family transcriptional regulator [Sphingopyxis sp. KK2]|uniref:GntR family transcriptional regulator n=1 Tax=Sphingopyxis sp. KK2 TaxID=1855727 RepID=UPI001181BFCF|nr:GntR family transcriptional regulator [Sphingopyxis sp. KK2]
MSPGARMEHAYTELKARVMAGEFAPGSKLDPGQLAAELGASATPVRDALHRLSGERLVDSWHQEGFRQPLVSEADLRDLYAWTAMLLGYALRSLTMPPVPPDGPVVGADGDDYPGRLDRLFRSIALFSPNREVRHAIASAVDRLHLVRALEHQTDPLCSEALADLEEDFRSARWPELRAKINSFHRRRLTWVRRVCAEMRKREEALG